MKLWSSDNTALILARTILRREPKVSLQIFLGDTCPEGAFSVSELWEKSEIKRSAGIAWNQACDKEAMFVKEQKELVSLPYELLSDFANRGLSDTVEFRRLARKYLRAAKNANCKQVFFLSGVLAEEKTQKILKHILGTQIQPVFVTDFLPEECFTPAKKQEIAIITDQNLERVHKEAEKFLHTKLAKGVVQAF